MSNVQADQNDNSQRLECRYQRNASLHVSHCKNKAPRQPEPKWTKVEGLINLKTLEDQMTRPLAGSKIPHNHCQPDSPHSLNGIMDVYNVYLCLKTKAGKQAMRWSHCKTETRQGQTRIGLTLLFPSLMTRICHKRSCGETDMNLFNMPVSTCGFTR